MSISLNKFDNYEIGDIYIISGRIAKVIGHSKCHSMVNGNLSKVCIGCKGRSRYKFRDRSIQERCAHNGRDTLVKVYERVYITNTRW